MVNSTIDLLLVNPINSTNPPAYSPIGLMSIATYLRENGFEVKILDRNAHRSDNYLLDALKKHNPRVVGISLFATGPLILDGLHVIRTIRKEMGNNTLIVCGGLHPTIFPEQVIADKDIDMLVLREGEETLLELLQKLGKTSEYKYIRGMVYKEPEGRVVVNPPRELIKDLNELPMLDWSLIEIPKYLDDYYFAHRVIVTITSRGCPHRCAFCWVPIFLKGQPKELKLRTRSAKKVIEEIELLHYKYKIDGIHFFDDGFDADKKRLKEICKSLKKEKIDIRWQHSSRVLYATRERLLMEKQSGCELVEYGVESGSPRMLNFIRKDQTVSHIAQAFKNCNEVKIKANALIMIGLPSETVDDLKMTVNLVDSLPHYYTVCNIYKPYPGSELFNYCLEKGLLKIPATMEEIAKVYGYTALELNMSEIPSPILEEVQNYYWKKNVMQEAKNCIRHLDFGRLINNLRKVPRDYAFKLFPRPAESKGTSVWK